MKQGELMNSPICFLDFEILRETIKPNINHHQR